MTMAMKVTDHPDRNQVIPPNPDLVQEAKIQIVQGHVHIVVVAAAAAVVDQVN